MNLSLLVPQPQMVRSGSGNFRFDRDFEDQVRSYLFCDTLPEGITELSLPHELRTLPESYRLDIRPDKILLATESKSGRFAAMTTLKQLLLQCPGAVLPCMTIDDWALFSIRGVMIDISRSRVPTMNTLQHMIDLLSLLKYNQLQLYMEHTFAYKGHEDVWKDSSPLTEAEIRGLDLYCLRRGIELVPNQNSLGHMERWLAHPAYKQYAECPEGFTDSWGFFRPVSTTLAPSCRESFLFLEGLYDQLLPLFSSRLFNAGGDEPLEFGMGRSRMLCEREGRDNVYAAFLDRLHSLAAERGKRLMVWADILQKYPHLLKDLPEDMIFVDWGYQEDHPFDDDCRNLAESGRDFIVCSGTSAWNSIGGRWGNCRGNIRNAAAAALKWGALGIMVSEWGDNGHMQQYPIPMPGYFLGAATAWNPEAIDLLDLSGALSLLLFGREQKVLAQALMLLEEAGSPNGVKIHNASLPGIMLFDHHLPHYRSLLAQYAGYDFSFEYEQLEKAEALLASVEPGETRILYDEIRFTAALMHFACDLGHLRLQAPHFLLSEIDTAARVKLADRLEKLIIEYRRLWLLRNRPGGLEESAGILEELVRLLRKQG
ncbi:beta-N-acetylhexosaminidase [Sediminispirochaeta smaragdinae]|uniref:beta-N-acetylhexosaminidase n=1 Tax=Sediminispirochaeta smaragdinae (strain DSM 11293 / JCM 15392 / SEBR 4228) TaxID=573413 RepID=E1R2P9_SEDSS|nr:family 20 glycosylhydrolase [Sediminispirochaeta smaragdinae]ADK80331.1 Glycoside hydrolase, family 20, catalytic core [Sediminispirochaeta smaragdinae DSM 11293]